MMTPAKFDGVPGRESNADTVAVTETLSSKVEARQCVRAWAPQFWRGPLRLLRLTPESDSESPVRRSRRRTVTSFDSEVADTESGAFTLNYNR